MNLGIGFAAAWGGVVGGPWPSACNIAKFWIGIYRLKLAIWRWYRLQSATIHIPTIDNSVVIFLGQ